MSSQSNTSLLLTPLKIRGVTFKNRIGVAPMCMYSAKNGIVQDFHFVNYGSFAIGGAGLVICEATAVEERGRITPGCPGLWNDEQIEPWKRIADFLKSQGSVAGIQLAHSGRKGSTYPPWLGRNALDEKDDPWEAVGPSAIPFAEKDWQTPKAATIEDIEQIKSAWVSAAKRAVKAGFEVIEAHYAHGYLLSTFLSPTTNKRTDKYGGSLENRMRLGLEIAEGIRKVLAENVVFSVRVSVTDYAENGWDLKETIEFAKELKKIGVDIIDCSSGGVISNVNYYIKDTQKIHLEGAAEIQKIVGIPTAAVGLITKPSKAESILKENGATLILLGRAFLDNPHWPYLAADKLGDKKSFDYPTQFEYCIGWNAFSKWRQGVNGIQPNL